MDAIEDHIIRRAHEFDRTNDWPQPFEAFVPPGESEARTGETIRAMQLDGKLTIADFEAEGLTGVEVVLGLGPRLARI
ncbi:hypothetical protein [Kineosporia succinea]|uniref:Uncharacterized protein n=1 Tax=Kineosporia succinea TaxID=84632 RepID=A0ABT9NWC8_9ACTN|nr:hypothetical protein [Kineosporia succinea]MDP9824459.1 hypothetical protein [Kineosporia succinea]